MNESNGIDWLSLKEDEIDSHATYIVPDIAVGPGISNRAEQSLPRNLVLKPSKVLTDVTIFF